MTKEYYSNGKLLLSGEYAVLDGAMAWAIPTRYGQYLSIASNTSSQIDWRSIDDKGAIWFEATYDTETLKELATSDPATSERLAGILAEAKRLNPRFLTGNTGYRVVTKLTFPRMWGLGSSSTLVNNIGNWAQVNAHELGSNTFGGSGYDIACAQHDAPILYKIEDGVPITKAINANLPFTDQLFFVYLNKKMNSRDAITAYKKRTVDKTILTKEISQITDQLYKCSCTSDFKHLIERHEQLLSEALGIPTIKTELFSDYEGSIKSLGGWGGDFILATGDEKTEDYFKGKGYNTLISFNDMIL